MARDLHRGSRDATLHHNREHSLQVRRLGCGQRARHGLARDAGLHAADEPAAVACHPQRRLQKVRRSGLTARPCDADHEQVGGRVSVHKGRDLAEPGSRIRHDKCRQAGRRCAAASRGVGQHCRRPSRGCGGGELGAVLPAAWQRHVQIAGKDPARVMGHPRKQALGRPARANRADRHAQQIGKLAQRPGLDAAGTHGYGHAERLPGITEP